MVIHDWDILERKSKSSMASVFIVYRVVHPRGGRPYTEYMKNPSVRSFRPIHASVFRTREGAEKAIAKAKRKDSHD